MDLVSVSGPQFRYKGDRQPERGRFQLSYCCGEVDHAPLRREIQQPEGTRHPEAPLSTYTHSGAFIHQQEAGPKRLRQRNRGGLCFIEPAFGSRSGYGVDLQPPGRLRNPLPDRFRRVSMAKFDGDQPGHGNFYEQDGKQLDVPDEDEVVDRAGAGNDPPNHYRPASLRAARSSSKSSNVYSSETP